ncbi:hypothetical protein CCX46_09045 [Pseudomonas sp. RU47]|uniref:hypothetical protein n=1 Tax=Pseudomonas sp. RU47 TaxID=2005388 RepID=UPI000FDEB353|nr:hypothetical protein [Pseudomonas sp. RU47]AZZ75289.1 hypothetical protein CCX46_09045 [Pseudomonas sp. RU47]
MLKKMLVLLVVSQLAACSNQPSSAYESGWTNDTNEDAYAACGSFRIKKGFQDPTVMEHLVASRQLSSEQASRAIQRDVRTGDPECLAYAAFGLDRHKISFYKNKAGELTAKSVTYQCSQSDVPCPGLKVVFTDGKVTSTSATSE